MSAILLITTNELLAAVYNLNIKNLFSIDIRICNGHEEAIKLLQGDEKFELLLSCAVEDDVEIAALIYQHMLESDLEIPFIVFGRDEDIPEELEHIEDAFDVAELVKHVTDVLNTTVSPQKKNEALQYFPINLTLFLEMKTTPCHVYHLSKNKNTDEYIKVFEAEKNIWPKIEKFRDVGVESLYVDSNHRDKFIDEVTKHFIVQLKTNDENSNDENSNDENSNNKDEEKDFSENISQSDKGMKILAQKIFDRENITEEIVEISTYCLRTIDDIIIKVPKIAILCELMTVNITGFLYSHSVIANGIARQIAKKLSWTNDSHIEIINYVFFFGDLFLAPIYDKYPHLEGEEESLFSELLTQDEKEAILYHAKNAANLIRGFPDIPKGVEQVILQHHGMVSGEGFAVKFRDDISPISKIINIAETYTEQLLKQRDFNLTREVKKEIIADLLDRFDRDSYHVFIEILGDMED